MEKKYKTAVLIVLDGFGVAPPSETNAIWAAKTPYFEYLINNYSTVLVNAAGLSVGLPFGEMGNSEVGHYNIGSGQLIYQSLPRINNSIEDGSFFNHETLLQVKNRLLQGGNLHLIGMIGTGGVHSHQKHLLALLEFCKKEELDASRIFIHAFLDGRDTAPNVGKKYLSQVLDAAQGIAQVASVSGRYYAMDRNNKWDRIEKAYNAMVKGESEQKTNNILEYLEDSYKKEVFDEEFLPTVITNEAGEAITKIHDNDITIFFNFRADRARQITQSFVEKDFDYFDRGERLKNLGVVTFTEYKKGLPVNVLYPPQIITEPLAKVISDAGLKQLHIAETEKYAHVTFFFNGLVEEPFEGEDRELIPSPAVATYDEKPEMSAFEITERLEQVLDEGKHDFILVNYANGDMVGHTGNKDASIKAIETLDTCLEKLVNKVLEKDGICFITADHGNVEEVFNYVTYEIDKEHSVFPVPFIVISKNHKDKIILKPQNKKDLSMYDAHGILADVAPTILGNLGIKKPESMKGGIDELIL